MLFFLVKKFIIEYEFVWKAFPCYISCGDIGKESNEVGMKLKCTRNAEGNGY